MKEELQIKVKVDTSSITTTLNKLKNEVSNVEKTMNTTASSSSSITNSTQKSAQAQGTLTARVKEMVGSLKGLKGGGITDLYFGIKGLNEGLDATKKKLKEVQVQVSKPFTVIQSKMADVVQGAIGKITNTGSGATEGFKLITAEDGKRLHALDDLKDKIDTASNLKGLVKLKGDMKALGLSTKGTGFTLKNFGAMLKAVGAAATLATAAIAALVAGLALFALGIRKALIVSKLGDEIYHNAHRFNMGTTAFQEWSYVMERAGGSIDDLTGFMETLASEQAAVIEGSEGAIDNFERLGLSAEKVAGMGQQELFEETVKRIQQMEDATERSAIAYSIFGDEASKFMNVLNMSNSEMTEMINNYHLLGGAMSGETLEASNRLQGAVQNLKQAWAGVGNTIAQVFIPIAQKVVEWLTKALVVVQLFLKTVLGLDLKQTIAGGMDSASSSTNKYSGSVKKATKAAEELKRVTMGFDELNIVSNPNAGSSDSSAGASSPSLGGGMDLGAAIPDMSSLNLEGIYAWFEEYKGIIAQIATWSLLLIGVLLAVIGCMTGNIPMAAIGIGMAGLGIVIGIKSGVWEEWFKKIKAVWDKLAPVFAPIVEFFKGAWSDIREMGAEAWEFIKDIWIHVQPFFEVLVYGIKQYFYDLQLKLEVIWAVISEAVKFVIEVIAAYWKLCWTRIKAVWDVVIGYFKAIWESIKLVFSAVGDVLSGNFKGAWEKIKSIVGVWVNWFKTIYNSICNVFKGIGTFFSDIFKGAFNGIIGIIEKALNAIIKRANKLSWDIPDWVPGIGGGKFGFNFKEVSIPRLATGGIATASTIANIGENGREAILPLDNNTEWMDALASKIAERNAGPSKIVLQVGEKELGWATINGINNITKQTGNIQLVL
jgi:hypothetical protein